MISQNCPLLIGVDIIEQFIRFGFWGVLSELECIFDQVKYFLVDAFH